MPNTFFQFKKFRVEQAQTAMKVSTEACVLGACTNTQNARNALDIGTGTGLLALMLAQKNENLQITAIEIEPYAFKQAQENIQNSVFTERIKVLHCSLQEFSNKNENEEIFDVIISNPPFYQNSLRSENECKNLAHHTQALPFDELVSCLNKLLVPHGKAWILLPPNEMDIFRAICMKKGLFIHKQISLQHSSKHKILRKICVFSKIPTDAVVLECICIKNEQNRYSEEFQELVQDFYL